MANEEHLAILQQGIEAWNQWRKKNFRVKPDLHGANLRAAILSKANLSKVDLSEAHLNGAHLMEADLSKAILHLAHLRGTNLSGADLRKADLRDADLHGAVLNRADLRGADLSRANLSAVHLMEADLRGASLGQTTLVGANLGWADLQGTNLHWADLCSAQLRGTNLTGANLSGSRLDWAQCQNAILSKCRISGASIWNVDLEGATQSDLIISDVYAAEITVDNLEVAQFVYMLLHNEKIRDVISTIGRKGVLILGRFGIPERQSILEAMRTKLREKGYLPIVFEFEKARERDFTETIKVLAGLSLFVIADITNPRSSPLELQATVPDYMIPFVPIIQAGEDPFSMFKDLQKKYRWVMDVLRYDSESQLMDHFESKILHPALAKHNELLVLKNEGLRIRDIDEC